MNCPYSYKPSCGSDGHVFVIVIENDKVCNFQVSQFDLFSDPFTRKWVVDLVYVSISNKSNKLCVKWGKVSFYGVRSTS